MVVFLVDAGRGLSIKKLAAELKAEVEACNGEIRLLAGEFDITYTDLYQATGT